MDIDVETTSKASRAKSAAGVFLAAVLTSAVIGGLTSYVVLEHLRPVSVEQPEQSSVHQQAPRNPETGHEEAIISVVEQAEGAVVSVIATQDLPVIERYYIDPFDGDSFIDNFFNFQIPQYRQNGTQPREVAAGTGFLVSADGLVVTNRHVVDVDEADFTVVFGNGERVEAEVVAVDTVEDLAVLRISRTVLSFLPLGDSEQLRIGQSVVAIGNALGEFNNTVSVGVVSGLGRRIVAGGGGVNEVIEDAIQTDAAINRGNSGGPLLNLSGEVVGINTAIVVGSENLGFAIPVNKAKKVISDVETLGYISRPFIGVRFVMVDSVIQEARNLPHDYGALVQGSGDGREPGILPDSPAAESGLREGDVILEVNGHRIDAESSLGSVIQQYSVGDEVTLHVFSLGEEREVAVKLRERP